MTTKTTDKMKPINRYQKTDYSPITKHTTLFPKTELQTIRKNTSFPLYTQTKITVITSNQTEKIIGKTLLKRKHNLLFPYKSLSISVCKYTLKRTKIEK